MLNEHDLNRYFHKESYQGMEIFYASATATLNQIGAQCTPGKAHGRRYPFSVYMPFKDASEKYLDSMRFFKHLDDKSKHNYHAITYPVLNAIPRTPEKRSHLIKLYKRKMQGLRLMAEIYSRRDEKLFIAQRGGHPTTNHQIHQHQWQVIHDQNEYKALNAELTRVRAIARPTQKCDSTKDIHKILDTIIIHVQSHVPDGILEYLGKLRGGEFSSLKSNWAAEPEHTVTETNTCEHE